MIIKKTLAAGVGLLMFVQVALAPRRAQASFAFEVAATVGWALALGWTGGSLAVVSINHFIELKNASTSKKVLRIAAAILTGLGALILLDADEVGSGVQLASLSAEDARKVGLTDAEWRAYENERFEISALSEQVVVDAERAVGTEDPTRLIAEIRANWDRDSERLLSAEARAAAHKIARSAIR
jgi:hypothetical protein